MIISKDYGKIISKLDSFIVQEFIGFDALECFYQVHNLLKPEDYWKYLREIWMGTDNVSMQLKEWKHLFRQNTDTRYELLMNDEERKVYDKLPDEVVAYRGYDALNCYDNAIFDNNQYIEEGCDIGCFEYYEDNFPELGLSWSLDRDQAEFFALRRQSDMGVTFLPVLEERKFKKSDIIAFINEREEQEILVDPNAIFNNSVLLNKEILRYPEVAKKGNYRKIYKGSPYYKLKKKDRVIDKELVLRLKRGFALEWEGPYGIYHSSRVLENGLRLAEETGASPIVIQLFALLHDSRIVKEEGDCTHGERAVLFLYRNDYLTNIDIADYKCLMIALQIHSAVVKAPDITESLKGYAFDKKAAKLTIKTCLDANTLDVGRFGKSPESKKLFTKIARTKQFINEATERSKVNALHPAFI